MGFNAESDLKYHDIKHILDHYKIENVAQS